MSRLTWCVLQERNFRKKVLTFVNYKRFQNGNFTPPNVSLLESKVVFRCGLYLPSRYSAILSSFVTLLYFLSPRNILLRQMHRYLLWFLWMIFFKAFFFCNYCFPVKDENFCPFNLKCCWDLAKEYRKKNMCSL